MSLPIEHRDETSGGAFFISRPETPGGEPLAEMTYRRQRAGEIVVEHTRVDPSVEGQGIAGRLLDALVAWARRESLRIVPRCSYVKARFEKDPALRDLQA